MKVVGASVTLATVLLVGCVASNDIDVISVRQSTDVPFGAKEIEFICRLPDSAKNNPITIGLDGKFDTNNSVKYILLDGSPAHVGPSFPMVSYDEKLDVRTRPHQVSIKVRTKLDEKQVVADLQFFGSSLELSTRNFDSASVISRATLEIYPGAAFRDGPLPVIENVAPLAQGRCERTADFNSRAEDAQ